MEQRGAGLLQNKDHLLLQAVEGLVQGGQRTLVVVLVVQRSRLYSQHILVVHGIELPEAAHVLFLRLFPLLVCREMPWETPSPQHSRCIPRAVPWGPIGLQGVWMSPACQ